MRLRGMKLREVVFPALMLLLTFAVIVVSFTDSLKGKMTDVGQLNKLHIFDSPALPYVPPPYPASLKQYIVAILPFEPSDGFTQAEADSVTSLLAHHLKTVWGIMVLERSSVDETPEVNCFIFGSLSQVSGQTVIDVGMFDPNGGESISADPLKVDGLSGLFLPMQSYAEELVPLLPGSRGHYVIGDTGPGGGVVFYSFFGHYMEAKGENGVYTWEQAMALPKNYTQDSFTDWLIPTAYELNLIYQTLKTENLGGFLNDYYWSSSLTYAGGFQFAWEQDFNNGHQEYFGSYTRVSHALLFRPFTSEL
jgi:hypothetical protein